MTCKFVAVRNGKKIPSIIYFTEIPFHPTSLPNYFLASFKDETDIEMESFLDLNINDLFKKIKTYLDENSITLTQCIRPHIKPSFYATEVDIAIAKYFKL